jgi:hypothetical protein
VGISGDVVKHLHIRIHANIPFNVETNILPICYQYQLLLNYQVTPNYQVTLPNQCYQYTSYTTAPARAEAGVPLTCQVVFGPDLR